MVLFNVEYEVPNGMTYICRCIGNDENEVIMDIKTQVGEIRVLSLYRVSEVHRLTDTVRKGIVERSLQRETQGIKKIGRPRKY